MVERLTRGNSMIVFHKALPLVQTVLSVTKSKRFTSHVDEGQKEGRGQLNLAIQARNWRRGGGGLPYPFSKIGKKCPNFGQKCPDCGHL